MFAYSENIQEITQKVLYIHSSFTFSIYVRSKQTKDQIQLGQKHQSFSQKHPCYARIKTRCLCHGPRSTHLPCYRLLWVGSCRLL